MVSRLAFTNVQVSRRVAFLVLLAATAFALLACKPASDSSVGKPTAQTIQLQPAIEASPTTKASEQWQVITSDSLTFTVTAPDANSVKILYRTPQALRSRLLRRLIPRRSPSGDWAS